MTQNEVRATTTSVARLARAGIALAGALIASAALAASASADNYIYWGQSPGTLGRANLDGTGVNPTYANVGSGVFFMGLAYNNANFFWGTAPTPTSSVRRAGIDGSAVTTLFSVASGTDFPPGGIAINSQYIYTMGTSYSGAGDANIGRSNIDGTGFNPSFLPLGSGQQAATGIAIDSQYIYWANIGTGSIGRANIDGTGVNPGFITGLGQPLTVAVNATHIYWTDWQGNTIGRANIDGTAKNTALVTISPGVPNAIAVDANYLYWSQDNTGVTTIGRANLDGTGANGSFVATTTNSQVFGLAVAPGGAAAVKYALSVTKAGSGSGTVTSSPAGVDCGSTCSAEYNGGTSVTLTAAPASDSTFTGWGGACSGAEVTCTVSMSEARSVTATFSAIPVPPPTPSNAFKLEVASTSGRTIRTLIRVSDPGRISQRGTRPARSSSARAAAAAVCSTSKTAPKAGIYVLTCKVNAATRKAQKKGKVRVLLRTTFTPTGGTARTVNRTVTLPSLKPRYAG